MSRRILYVYGVLAAIYAITAFVIPPEQATLEQYNLTELKYDLMQLTIVIPLLVIWLAAFYGFDKFKLYARTIGGSKDGRAFDYIANGLGVLALSMPVSSIISNIIRYFTVNFTDLIPSTTIFRNYLTITFSLFAFWLIHKGSQMLSGVSDARPRHNEFGNTIAMGTASLAVLYTFLIFQNTERQIPAGTAWRATYYLPDGLIIFTIILPYLYFWLLGFQSVVNINSYASRVKGVLYKQMLGLLSKGLTAIILISILLQILINFGSLFRSMSLGPLLLIVYLLIAAIAAGYIYVAKGASQLQKIEEV